MRRTRGYTLLELVIAMAIFGIFLMILTVLTAEMTSYEKKLPINFMKHPQVSAVVSRMRKDVLDADLTTPYPAEWPPGNPQYTQTNNTLIVNSFQEDGSRQTIVWDFRDPGVVTRRAFNVGISRDWVARGLPPQLSKIDIDSVEIPGRNFAVRFRAIDEKGRIAIDQIFQPRAHK